MLWYSGSWFRDLVLTRVLSGHLLYILIDLHFTDHFRRMVEPHFVFILAKRLMYASSLPTISTEWRHQLLVVYIRTMSLLLRMCCSLAFCDVLLGGNSLHRLSMTCGQ